MNNQVNTFQYRLLLIRPDCLCPRTTQRMTRCRKQRSFFTGCGLGNVGLLWVCSYSISVWWGRVGVGEFKKGVGQIKAGWVSNGGRMVLTFIPWVLSLSLALFFPIYRLPFFWFLFFHLCLLAITLAGWLSSGFALANSLVAFSLHEGPPSSLLHPAVRWHLPRGGVGGSLPGNPGSTPFKVCRYYLVRF